MSNTTVWDLVMTLGHYAPSNVDMIVSLIQDASKKRADHLESIKSIISENEIMIKRLRAKGKAQSEIDDLLDPVPAFDSPHRGELELFDALRLQLTDGATLESLLVKALGSDIVFGLDVLRKLVNAKAPAPALSSGKSKTTSNDVMRPGEYRSTSTLAGHSLLVKVDSNHDYTIDATYNRETIQFTFASTQTLSNALNHVLKPRLCGPNGKLSESTNLTVSTYFNQYFSEMLMR